jgi:methyl coenzyme M reductase alpha subunit
MYFLYNIETRTATAYKTPREMAYSVLGDDVKYFDPVAMAKAVLDIDTILINLESAFEIIEKCPPELAQQTAIEFKNAVNRYYQTGNS